MNDMPVFYQEPKRLKASVQSLRGIKMEPPVKDASPRMDHTCRHGHLPSQCRQCEYDARPVKDTLARHYAMLARHAEAMEHAVPDVPLTVTAMHVVHSRIAANDLAIASERKTDLDLARERYDLRLARATVDIECYWDYLVALYRDSERWVV